MSVGHAACLSTSRLVKRMGPGQKRMLLRPTSFYPRYRTLLLVMGPRYMVPEPTGAIIMNHLAW